LPSEIRPNSGVSQKLSGITRADIREAEKAARYVAIYVIWERSGECPGKHCMIGTTISPNERPQVAQSNNWREVDWELFWTPGQEIADRLVAMIRHEAEHKRDRAGGNWYAIEHKRMIAAVEQAARVVGVRLFTTEERRQRLVKIATEWSDEQKAFEATGDSRAVRQHKAEVVQLSDRRPRK
jgi:hypothetical protein